jgi:hypothetical protein
MKYACTLCEYETDVRQLYYGHCKTNKHNKNKEEYENHKTVKKPELILMKCTICNGLFENTEIIRHVEKCTLASLCGKQLAEVTELNKELIMTNKDLNNKLNESNNKFDEAYKKLEEANKNHYSEMKEANDKIQQIFIEYKIENKEDKEYFKDLVQKAGTVVTSVMDYLKKNCSDTPITKKLEHYELEETEDGTCDYLVFNEKNDTLVDYLVKHMTKKYIENDITKQTFWSTDVSRYSYIFRGVRNLDDADNKCVWLYDKEGVKIREIVVRPFLNYIGDIINKKLKNILPIDIRREPMYGDYLSKIYKKIELLTLERNIVVDMASHFQFDKTLLSDNKLEYETKKAGCNGKATDDKLMKCVTKDDEKVIKKMVNVKKTIKAKIVKK